MATNKETLNLFRSVRTGNPDKARQALECATFDDETLEQVAWITAKENSDFFSSRFFPHLFRHGANPNAIDQQGESLLSFLASANASNLVKEAINAGASLEANGDSESETTPLMVAAFNLSVESAAVILQAIKEKEGAAERLVNKADVDGDAAIHQAIDHGAFVKPQIEIDMLNLLLDAGADPNARNGYGSTPLMACTGPNASNANIDLMKILIDAGADPFLKNNGGYTALDLVKDNELFSSEHHVSDYLQSVVNERQLADLEPPVKTKRPATPSL